MSEDNPHRSSGKVMLWIAWLLILGGGWWAAQRWMDNQSNPNQRVAVTGNGMVVLERNRQGHYVADGEINGKKVTFMLDTGATSVALSSRLARELGLKRGAAVQVNTANGAAPAFETRLGSVCLGAIVVHDVSANFSDGMMDDTVLLGMSFLKHLEFTQRENQLILRPLR
ncbi:MAG: TIGR02281 family clan AA aspartic protease [Hydrogenophilales bacterium]|nr:TIGR02281 family clan AA aspartic protease [Hydrogenophilales bacterium]